MMRAGLAFEAGLYRAITKSPSAAARRRRSRIDQGFRLSESEMAQKSCPSGAPSRAAAACIAETPGATEYFETAPRRIVLDRLEDSRRHGENARIAARDDGDVEAVGGKLQREPGAVELVAVVARMDALAGRELEVLDIGRVADDVARHSDGRARLRRHPPSRTRAQTDDRNAPAHGRRPRPGARMSEK